MLRHRSCQCDGIVSTSTAATTLIAAAIIIDIATIILAVHVIDSRVLQLFIRFLRFPRAGRTAFCIERWGDVITETIRWGDIDVMLVHSNDRRSWWACREDTSRQRGFLEHHGKSACRRWPISPVDGSPTTKYCYSDFEPGWLNVPGSSVLI